LLFWKLLKQHYGKLIHLASLGYDLNAYANIICTEVCYYHLLKANTSTYSPQNHGAFIELCEMLESIHNEGQERLGLKDGSLSLLLDTLAYVYCGMDEAPLKNPSLLHTSTGSSSGQFPSSKKKQTILLLIQLLEMNKMKYQRSCFYVFRCYYQPQCQQLAGGNFLSSARQMIPQKRNCLGK
jgi:hypothetical protein